MSFVVKDIDVVRLVMGYLKSNGCYEALSSLALEADASYDELPDDLLYLQRLVLQGRWDVVVKYLHTLRIEVGVPEILDKLDYTVHRQKYLELLSWQGGGAQRMIFPPWKPTAAVDATNGKADGKDDDGNIEMSTLVRELNTLKALCSAAEFNSLCAFLTLDRLESHPDFQHWTVAQGRWTCFAELASALGPLVTGRSTQSETHSLSRGDGVNQGLLKTIAMSLAYQTALALDQPFSEHHHEQVAQFNPSAGYIVPVHENGQSKFANFDDKSTPSLVVQAPLQFRRWFDKPAELPNVDLAKVQLVRQLNIAQEKHSPGRHVKKSVPSPPRHEQDTAHHLRVPVVPAPALHAAEHVVAGEPPLPHLKHQTEVYASPTILTAVAAPRHIVPPPAGYGYAVPEGYQQNPNVFGFMPAGAALGAMPQVSAQVPAVVQGPVLSSRLSIETGEGQLVDQYRAQAQAQAQMQAQQFALQQHYQQQQMVYPILAPGQVGGFVQQNYAPVESFTPQAPMPGNYFQQQSVQAPYSAAPLVPHEQFVQLAVPHTSPPTSHSKPNHVNVVVRSGPADAAVPGKAPVAWTAGQETSGALPSARGEHRAQSSVPKPSEAAAVVPPSAFTVPVVDEAKVKQMPAALRRKMEADKEAAALAAEERQQESLQAERAASRGRARSVSRGGAAAAVPVTIATPSSSARPQSALKSRGGPSTVEQPSAPSAVRGGGAAVSDVRKSSETAISKFSNQSQPSQAASVRSGGGSRIPMAAPQSVHSGEVPSSAGSSQRNNTVPALPAEKVEYEAHLLYESKCPLRCVNVLGGGPARTQFAVGSNAKAILTMSYARGEVDAGRSVRSSVVMDRELSGVHNGSVYCMDYHAGLGLIASGSNDKAIRFCSPTTGQFGESMKEHTGTIRVVKFLSEGSGAAAALLASAGAGDCKPRLWDAQTGRIVRAMSEHPDAIHGLAWVNENLFVTGCDAGVIAGQDLRSPRPAWSYSLSDALPPGAGGQKGICCLSLLGNALSSGGSPNAVPMVAGGLGGFVTLFNAANGQIYSHEKLHTDDVRSVSVLPATARSRGELSVDMLTGSYDGTAALWRVSLEATSRVRYDGSPRVLTGHTDKVLSAVPFFAGGRSAPDILTTGAEGKVILWTLP